MLLFPQLPHYIAVQIAEEARSAPISLLAKRATTEHPACEYTPIGGTRASKAALEKLRRDLVELAATAGYPNEPGQQRAARFDVHASLVLFEQMQLAPAEAAKSGVWEFVSCVLAPDLARWRFGGSADATPLERFASGRRNVFQRLWWRSFHLAPRGRGGMPLPQILAALGEDEVVQLMERPSLAGIQGLPASIAAGLLAASKSHSNVTRRHLIREAQKRLLRLSSFVSLESIGREEIDRHVSAVFEQVAAALPRQQPSLRRSVR